MNPIALDALYRAQQEAARAAKRAPWHTTAWQTPAMLAWMATHAGGRLSAGQANRTWVWSDLHLDHADVISVFSRPFRTIWQMQTALLQAWLQTVDEADIILCLGDVTVGARRAALDEALAALPGTKILVAGNHDMLVDRPPKDYSFEAAYPTLVCETAPPLLMTHEPLKLVPRGCVNIHGHLPGSA